MKNYKLDEEEKQILKDYDDGKYVSVDNLDEEIKAETTKNTLQNQNINIRLQERDIRTKS